MIRPLQARDDASARAKLEIGKTVRHYRLQRGLTQRELAARLHVGNTTISAIEIGRNSISPEHYDEMADALGLDRASWGKFLLKVQDPFLYGCIFGYEHVNDRLENIYERITREEPAE